jgi:ribosomal protein S27AE
MTLKDILLCRFWFHAWGRWQTYEVTFMDGGKSFRQHRTCARCGRETKRFLA